MKVSLGLRVGEKMSMGDARRRPPRDDDGNVVSTMTDTTRAAAAVQAAAAQPAKKAAKKAAKKGAKAGAKPRGIAKRRRRGKVPCGAQREGEEEEKEKERWGGRQRGEAYWATVSADMAETEADIRQEVYGKDAAACM